MTYYLKFTDETHWTTEATAAGFIEIDPETSEETLMAYTKDHAIDVVGTIIEGGEWDEDGNELVAPTVLSGYHVNYQGDLPDGWDLFEVAPVTPVRKWF